MAWAIGSPSAAVRWRWRSPPTQPAIVTDADALRQVLTNFLDNALRYSPPGSSVTVVTSRRDHGTVVAVRDRGPGIPGEHLPRIFERFYRADPSRSRDEGGTGLGLAIVKHLVEAQGGRVWAVSRIGEGTTVSAWVPDITATPGWDPLAGRLTDRFTGP